jgi:hypothetical protein
LENYKKYNTNPMKALFLVVLIIAYTNSALDIPTALLGNWEYSSTTCNINCIESFSFTSTGDSSLEQTETVYDIYDCNIDGTSVSKEISNIVYTTMAQNTVQNITAEYSLSNLGGELTLSFNSTSAPCITVFTKNAYFMKATIVAVIAAAFMLF